jgi:hypothetical protein
MQNVNFKVTGTALTIEVDLSKSFGPSKSGKTIIIASTQGNVNIPGGGVVCGLNIYKTR